MNAITLLAGERDGLRRSAAGKPDGEGIKFRKSVFGQPVPFGQGWIYRTGRNVTKCDRCISDVTQLTLLIVPITVPMQSGRADGGH